MGKVGKFLSYFVANLSKTPRINFYENRSNIVEVMTKTKFLVCVFYAHSVVSAVVVVVVVVVAQRYRCAVWLGGVTVMTLELRQRGRGFDSRPGRYQVVSTCMARYTISVYDQHSAFYLSEVTKLSTGLKPPD